MYQLDGSQSDLPSIVINIVPVRHLFTRHIYMVDNDDPDQTPSAQGGLDLWYLYMA